MISVTIFINARPIVTYKAVNKGLVSPEDLPKGANPDAPICWYELQDEHGHEFQTFMHDRSQGGTACAYRMLWNASQKEQVERLTLDAGTTTPAHPAPEEKTLPGIAEPEE